MSTSSGPHTQSDSSSTPTAAEPQGAAVVCFGTHADCSLPHDPSATPSPLCLRLRGGRARRLLSCRTTLALPSPLCLRLRGGLRRRRRAVFRVCCPLRRLLRQAPEGLSVIGERSQAVCVARAQRTIISRCARHPRQAEGDGPRWVALSEAT